MELELFETTWLDVWDGREPREPVGAVFTKPEIVALVLDLAGYRPAAGRLSRRRVLEPSCGDGAFLSAVIERMLAAERAHAGPLAWEDAGLDDAIRACDLNSGFVGLARRSTGALLAEHGCPPSRAEYLAGRWIVHADFLLTAWPGHFDFVVGNPPYVRIEDLPPAILQRYRSLYATCADRADLYVAFFEKGLRLLSPGGCLAYICANRFAKNLYGRRLRELIAARHRVRYYLNLEHTQPFANEVSAYPCITVIDGERGGPTLAATLEDLAPATLAAVRPEAAPGDAGSRWARFPDWYRDGAPWIATRRDAFDRLNEMAGHLPCLEESAPDTVVGIGVATGADDIYVLPAKSAEIEEACQLPLVMAADIAPAALTWSGHHLVDPFDDATESGLRDLAAFPGLGAYFARHRELLERRHVAKKRPRSWYRTIDRVTHSLIRRPKLLLPDIQAGGVVGFDAGAYYPHHNVYWITSEGWDLRTLQALLRSTLVLEQVRAHSVQLRGGSLRYQAQVLRKIRVPAAASFAPGLAAQLAAHAGSSDQRLIDALAGEAFGCEAMVAR